MEKLFNYKNGVVELALSMEDRVETLKVVVFDVEKMARKLYLYQPMKDGRLFKFSEVDLKAILIGDSNKLRRYDIFGMRIRERDMLKIVELDLGEGYEFNRRRAYRVAVEGLVGIKLEEPDWMYYSMVDISQDGIGIKGERKVGKGSRTEVKIKHIIDGKEIILKGAIVREEGEEIEGISNIRVGVEYLEQSRELKHFIYQKQKEELQRRKEKEYRDRIWQ